MTEHTEQLISFFFMKEISPAFPGGAYLKSVFSSTDKKMSLGVCLIAVHLLLEDFCHRGRWLMEFSFVKPFPYFKTSIKINKVVGQGGVFKLGFPRDVAGVERTLLFSFKKYFESFKNSNKGDFPGGPVAKTPCFQCMGPVFDP